MDIQSPRRPDHWQPDFEQLLRVLRRQPTDRPVLYELFMNYRLYVDAAGHEPTYYAPDQLGEVAMIAHGFANLGYDYFTPWRWSDFRFAKGDKHKAQSISQNEGGLIFDRASFEAYAWPDADAAAYVDTMKLAQLMPDGVKMVPSGPGGVLENTIDLVGFERLCFMILDEPDLAQDVFDAVGSCLLGYYRHCLAQDVVGAIMVNDDWGFKTQTMLSTEQMRRYVFPWHKKIVAAAHEAGRPAILHSCGYPGDIFEDIIQDMAYDAKHSYEDTIIPPEQAYERWGDRIAIMGGIDVDFLCRSSAQQIHNRARKLLAQTGASGGYALGSGNSIPEYIPRENYLAMVQAAWEGW
jgi:uroporphyrinogen decarboxylase